MDSAITIAALLSAVVGASGCGHGEACYYNDNMVSLSMQPLDGGIPPSANLHAKANGFSCGCCGGRASTTITLFEWDLSGLGVSNQSGADLRDVVVQLPIGHSAVVTVAATDSAGKKVMASIMVPPG